MRGPQFDITLRNLINNRIEEDQELNKAVSSKELRMAK